MRDPRLNGKATDSPDDAAALERAARSGRPAAEARRTCCTNTSARLDRVIQERTAAILSGKARRDDFLVHGARALLEQLSRRGLTLVILSGTRRASREAGGGVARLGALFRRAHLRRHRRPGAVVQRAVIGRLLREEKISGENLLSFGDGPVEIELTKEAGGLAVAVASDEEQNGSGEMHPQKHKLLAGRRRGRADPRLSRRGRVDECILAMTLRTLIATLPMKNSPNPLTSGK